MLAIFGNETAARVLLYVQNYGEGYARAIAQTFELPHSMVQKQLLRLESETGHRDHPSPNRRS